LPGLAAVRWSDGNASGKTKLTSDPQPLAPPLPFFHTTAAQVVQNAKNNVFPQPEISLVRAAAQLATGRLPGTIAGTPGWCAAAASLLEATARKPGNVHPEASFPDLNYDDLCAAAVAIAPVLDTASQRPLGAVIQDAVDQSRAVSRSNANLGIILAIAPLAASSNKTGRSLSTALINDRIAACDSTDAAAIYAAIRTAKAGGLGTRHQHDLAGQPPASIITAMQLAARATPADSIAALWADGYDSLWQGPVADLARFETAGCGWEEAIMRTAVAQLARTPDSLIARRHGTATAVAVSTRAAAILPLSGAAWTSELLSFDQFLRQPNRLNPGTTADLIATALYIHLWNNSNPSPEPSDPCPNAIR
jgi:triphosphoribosyl-dephospho-CoA synthase